PAPRGRPRALRGRRRRGPRGARAPERRGGRASAWSASTADLEPMGAVPRADHVGPGAAASAAPVRARGRGDPRPDQPAADVPRGAHAGRPGRPEAAAAAGAAELRAGPPRPRLAPRPNSCVQPTLQLVVSRVVRSGATAATGWLSEERRGPSSRPSPPSLGGPSRSGLVDHVRAVRAAGPSAPLGRAHFFPSILWCWVLVLKEQRPASPPLLLLLAAPSRALQ
ncbi:unnamed protein product, partial [Prorocentrum cordatum]